MQTLAGRASSLKVALMRGVLSFEKKCKPSSRLISLFEILERIEPMAYTLALSPTLAVVHNMFHVSILWKYTSTPTHVIKHETLPFLDDLSYEKISIRIVASDVKSREELWNKEISLVKVQWGNHRDNEATWKSEEEDMRRFYPSSFKNSQLLGTKIL